MKLHKNRMENLTFCEKKWKGSSSSPPSATFLTSQQFSWFSKEYGPTDQTLRIHCSAKNFLTVWHVLNITAFCIRIYRAGQRLSSFNLSCNLFRIIPVVDSTSGYTGHFQLPYSYKLFFQGCNFCGFSVTVL